MSRMPALLACALLGVWVACRPGGDSGDQTPPTVTLVVPGAGATLVALDASVVVTFSEAMAPATVNAATITLGAGAVPVPAVVTYDDGTHAATLTPTSPLAASTTYTLTVAASVSDASDNPLGTAYTSSFSTIPALGTWAAMTTGGAPLARHGFTSVWTGSRMIVWGGIAGGEYQATGGSYDPVGDAWTATNTGGAPSKRTGHVAVWTGSRMVVWGGGWNAYDVTGGRYDPVGDTWQATSTSGVPAARWDATAVWTGSRMIVWGGWRNSEPAPDAQNGGGRYDPSGDAWTGINTAGAPSGRYGHTAVWTGSRMIVWGGTLGGGAVTDTGGIYDPVADTWTAMSTDGAPSARERHTAVWDDVHGKMIVWGGGVSTSTYLATGAAYDPATNAWTSLRSEGAPTARQHHSAVWTGSRMIVWGGTGPSGANDGASYDPATDTWAPIQTSGQPSPRVKQGAVWAGSRMIVWGGYYNGYLGTGGVYTP